LTSQAEVDRHCNALFLDGRVRESDDNLLFVRDRLLRSEVDLSDLLELYRKVLRRRNVAEDRGDPRVNVLQLSGVVRTIDGRLVVRNRIYRRVFAVDWVRNHLPDQERLRQAAAYRRGVFMATAAAVVLIAIVVTPFVLYELRVRRLKSQEREVKAHLSEAEQRLKAAQLERARNETEGDHLRTRAERLRYEVEDESRVYDKINEQVEMPLTSRVLDLAKQIEQLIQRAPPDLQPQLADLKKADQQLNAAVRRPLLFQVFNTGGEQIVAGLDAWGPRIKILPGMRATLVPRLLDAPTIHVYGTNSEGGKGTEILSAKYLALSSRYFIWDGAKLQEVKTPPVWDDEADAYKIANPTTEPGEPRWRAADH
jgi:F0F1-type ATP synthase membrane subunit b/b'